MRFAIDAHAIGRHLTGNEVYVRGLLNGFAAIDKKSEFLTYVSMQEAVSWVPERFPVRHIASNPFARLGFDFARQLRADRPELLHVQYTAPLFCPVPIVVSVHDISFLEHPEYFTPARRTQLRYTVERTIRRAARILTVSEFSRDCIVRAYGLDSDRIVIAPDAANPLFRATNRMGARKKVELRFQIGAPFVLCVGDLQPRKNQIGLITAFGKLVRAHPQLKHHLVLAGKDTWFAPKIYEAARTSGIADRIHFTGFVSDDELLNLYNACDCFVFPSWYEGFGIPILEAMACGRAVACSNTSSMPEVADGAGLLFDPYHNDEITRAMADILLDSELRARMERLGQQRATLFTWQQSAQIALSVFHEVAERNHPARSRVRSAPSYRR